MKVLITGAGIAGLTLAYWLGKAKHDVSVVEKSPSLRDEGYMIDFFGAGHDVSARMGLLTELERIHYPIERLAFLDPEGREKFSIAYPALRRLFNGRHFNFLRGDLVRVLYSAVRGSTDIRFASTVVSVCQEAEAVDVVLSDGSAGRFDLLVGADGVHSSVRRLCFGEESRFSRPLGYNAAAYLLRSAPRSLAGGSAFQTLTVPGRQVAIYPIRGGRFATFFLYRAERRVADFSLLTATRELRTVFGDLGWIVPELLDRIDPSTLYFDEVAQIQLPAWSFNRVVLVGDACQCVSLLAGQGASLAMTGACALAEVLSARGDTVTEALARYERCVRPDIEDKQKAGRRLARWFIPETPLQLCLRDLATRSATWPVAWRLARRWIAADRATPARTVSWKERDE